MLLPTACLLLGLGIAPADGLAGPAPRRHGAGGPLANDGPSSSRRAFLSSAPAATAAAALLSLPLVADARYVLNEDTGEYDELPEEDWQSAWGKRLDKAKSMSTEEVFLAAQGAGNLDLKEGVEESEASKKRRALAGCRNDRLRERGGTRDARECAARVLGGDYQFMIDAM